jgi:hypothetical protein
MALVFLQAHFWSVKEIVTMILNVTVTWFASREVEMKLCPDVQAAQRLAQTSVPCVQLQTLHG